MNNMNNNINNNKIRTSITITAKTSKEHERKETKIEKQGKK